MKRDMDLVRKILLDCEKSPERWFSIGTHEWSDHDMRETFLDSDKSPAYLFHIDLLTQGKLLGRSICDENNEDFFEITWAGYDYLDAVRNDGIWQQTKEAVSKTGGSVAIELVKSIAVGFGKKQLEKHTGFKL